jgi:predicted flap endonuclease-1-like 5' DNA nuclease
MKVKNNWTRPIRIGRQTLVKGEVANIPDNLLYTPRVQRLRDAEKLIFPWVKKEEAEEPAPEAKPAAAKPATPAEPDDLTQLPHVGTGRARKLNEAGVKTFAEVVELGADDLDSLLDVTKTQAAEIVEAAKARMG